jgi:hypothetical protein
MAEPCARTQEEAQSRFAAVLARAKAFDADGKREECMQAAEEATLLLGLN